MGRKYKIPVFLSSDAGANASILQIVSSSSKVTILRAIRLEQSSDYGDAAAEGLRVQVNRGTVPGTPGGTTITPAPISPSDTAFNGTVRSRPDSGTGVLANLTSTTTLAEFGMNIQAGILDTPPEGWGIEIAPSAAIELKIVTDMTDSMDLEYTVDIEELG
jgi:hypothetical protein